MSAEQGQVIRQVIQGSLAFELGIQSGDRLLGIDGRPVLDVFDYQIRQLAEELVVSIQSRNGELLEFEIEKEEEEDLGLEFENPLLSECTHCHNRCVFCFIDQLPRGMRRSLYFKDDDMRMSFLHGNYVTLTNISDEEFDRLVSYRFSPMNISVHATDPEIRRKIMRNRHAGNLFERLQKLSANGIKLNCQLVLCPGWNDGAVLEQTLEDLSSLGDAVMSIAMVPVGITRYREENGLIPMEPFSVEGARNVIRTVEIGQTKRLRATGNRTIFAGDEFYIRAGLPFPAAEEYEDYPQLENGVGMAALFIDTMQDFLAYRLPAQDIVPIKAMIPGANELVTVRPNDSLPLPMSADEARLTAMIATGTAAAPIIDRFCSALSERFNLEMELVCVINDFFGATVTVAGLITGQDLINQLRPALARLFGSGRYPVLLLPDCMLKQDEAVFLDDMKLQELTGLLGCPILVVPEQAQGLIAGLERLAMCNTSSVSV